MRAAVIADVHGNLPALRAVLDAAERAGAETHLVLGDLVGYGGQPNECVELVAGLGGTVIAGNHDLIALGRLSDERCIPLARESLRWTQRVLAPSSRAYLESLELTARPDPRVFLAHGTIDDPQGYTASARAAAGQLRRLAETAPEARVLLLGHTHRPLAFAAVRGSLGVRGSVALGDDEAVLLNPGAAGQSREPRALARGLLLDSGAGTASFLRVAYHRGEARRALQAAGLSPRGIHLRPGPRRAAAVLREDARRLRARLSRRPA